MQWQDPKLKVRLEFANMIQVDMLILLRDAEAAHREAEKRLPEHPWEVWYAAYIESRMQDAAGGLAGTLAQHRAGVAVEDWLAQQKSHEATMHAFQGEG